MYRFRVIPSLLLKDRGLVKTVKFNKPKYIGDPINAIKIFNDKEADELMFLDIQASKLRREPDYDLIAEITGECFMPLSYGGGIRNIEQIRKLLFMGVEKVVLNSYAFENPSFIKQATDVFGSSTIVVSIDVKKDWLGRTYVYSYNGEKKTAYNPVEAALLMEKMGAGEIVVNSIDRDGTMEGYDITLIKSIADAVGVPVIALGGASKISDFSDVIYLGNASAAAAGSMFVFHGNHQAVLITYPTSKELEDIFEKEK